MDLEMMRTFDLIFKDEKNYFNNFFGRRWTGAEN